MGMQNEKHVTWKPVEGKETEQCTTGISCMKQMTGHESHNIQHTIIAAIAGGADADFMRPFAPTFMSSSIQEMEACLAGFCQYECAILEAGTQRGRNGDIPHFQTPKLELFQSFGCTICRVGSLIQYTADVSKHLLIIHAKNPFLHMNHKAGFTEQITCYLDCEESICLFDLYTLLCTNGTLFASMLTSEDSAIPLPHSVVPEEDYSFTGSATFHNHFLQGFMLDDAMTAFHVTQQPDFADNGLKVCFTFIATPAEQLEVRMYTVCCMSQAGAIIPILDVMHAVKLIPKYGAMAS
ncbi:hypothetical protein EDD17DRAFT_1774408 [Pisolithus thermaeus]|nr:hypothetical protein EDD17DRAFT_1774408 [Pisolithus thermaeus]